MKLLSYFLLIILSETSCCPTGWSNEPSEPTLCYYFVNSASTWQSASQFCASFIQGSSLPIFHTLSEYISYHSFAKVSGQISCALITWLGLHYYSGNGSAIWSDGNNLSFQGLWAPGQPGTTDNCVQHFASGGYWMTQLCNSPTVTYTYYCQYRTNQTITTSSTSYQSSNSCVSCPVNWILDQSGICYFYAENLALNWTSAASYCQNLLSTSSLPIFRTSFESLTYLNLLEDLFIPCVSSQWIAMTDLAQNGMFLWSDGTSPSFYQWKQGSPSGRNTTNCVSSNGWLYGNASWSDTFCSRQLYFVCQLRITANCSEATTTRTTSGISTTGVVNETTKVTTMSPLFSTSSIMTTEVVWTAENITTTSTDGNSVSSGFSTETVNGVTTKTSGIFTTNLKPNTISRQALTTTNGKINSTFLQTIGLTGVQTDPLAVVSTIQDSIPFLTAPLNMSLKTDLGYQFHEMVISCTYSSQSCNSIQYFTQSYNPLLGNCYTFNGGPDPNFYVTRAGLPYGLRVVLFASQSDYMCTSIVAGFKIGIHENNAPSFPDADGYYMPPGSVAYFNLRQKQLQRLGSPYGDCIDDANESYTIEACQRDRFQRFLISSCNCADPRYPNPTNVEYCSILQKNCLNYAISCENAVIDSAECLSPCNEIEYEVTVTISKFIATDFQNTFCRDDANASNCQKSVKNGMALIYMFYDSMTYVTYSEQPSYPLLNLLGDFSNVTGLYLGVCAMTIFEVGLFLIYVVFAVFEKLMKSKRNLSMI